MGIPLGKRQPRPFQDGCRLRTRGTARCEEAPSASDFIELAAQWTMEDAEPHAIARDCVDARREIAAGLELTATISRWSARDGRPPAVQRRGSITTLSDELRGRFPNATLTARIHLPVIAAALAFNQRDFAGR